MRLIDYMDKKWIFLDLVAHSKSEAIAAMVGQMKESKAISDEAELLEEINNREIQGGTSLGNGIAIPHARLKSLDRIVVAVARLAEAVDFCNDDCQPVRLVFILITPSHKAGEYLKVLAKLAKFLKEKSLRDKLLAAGSVQATWELFESIEHQDI
jgi:PTS system nitrogen regulatory IIA component